MLKSLLAPAKGWDVLARLASSASLRSPNPRLLVLSHYVPSAFPLSFRGSPGEPLFESGALSQLGNLSLSLRLPIAYNQQLITKNKRNQITDIFRWALSLITFSLDPALLEKIL